MGVNGGDRAESLIPIICKGAFVCHVDFLFDFLILSTIQLV